MEKYIDLHTTRHGRAPNRSAIDTYREVLDADPRTNAEVDGMIDDVVGLRRRERAFDFGELLLVGAATGLGASVLYEYKALVPSVLVLLIAAAAAIHFRDVVRERLSWKRAVIVFVVFAAVAVVYAKRDGLADVARAAVVWVNSHRASDLRP